MLRLRRLRPESYDEAIPYLQRAFELNEETMRGSPRDRGARFDTSTESYLLSIAMFSKPKPEYAKAERFGELTVGARAIGRGAERAGRCAVGGGASCAD